VMGQGPAAWTNVREDDNPLPSGYTANQSSPYAASLCRFFVNSDVTNMSHFFTPARFSGM
jgi:hypothetical protein